MTLVALDQLTDAARQGTYAVGYFESWSLESLLAVADAAEAVRSPVILGFSGIYLPDPLRHVRDPLTLYAAMGLEVCRRISVPASLLFNESPYLEQVLQAVDLGFNLVMFSDEELGPDERIQAVTRVVEKAHAAGAAVEAELDPLPGVAGELAAVPGDLCLSDPQECREFVERTGIDALAVNVGQAHLHGRSEVSLDHARLRDLARAVPVPMVLHGSSSVPAEDLRAAIEGGVRKINVGSVLKQTYFDALRRACADTGELYNPYLVLGSGMESDVLVAGRIALQKKVEELLLLFGSAGQAKAAGGVQ
jgi:ketose-bisphosphate aldolase